MAEAGQNYETEIAQDFTEEIPLGERLLEKGVLSEDQLRIALVEQEADPSEPLGRVLVKLGFVTESTIRDVLSESKGAQSIDLTNVSVDPVAVGMVPIDIAKRYNVFPVGYDEENNILSIAAANPDDLLLFDQLQEDIFRKGINRGDLLDGKHRVAVAIGIAQRNAIGVSDGACIRRLVEDGHGPEQTCFGMHFATDTQGVGSTHVSG